MLIIFNVFVIIIIASGQYAAGSTTYSAEGMEDEQLWIISATGENIESRSFLTDAPDVLPDRENCGLDTAQVRILSGRMTDMKEFPWMAALEYRSRTSKENAGIRCGGSIINSRYILTAAHCISDPEFEIVKVRLGEWDIIDNPDCLNYRHYRDCADPVKNFSVEEAIVYPTFGLITSKNDIGLLRLNEEISFSGQKGFKPTIFLKNVKLIKRKSYLRNAMCVAYLETEYIKPICLPSPGQPDPEHLTLMTVAGWGLTENGYKSRVKLKVEVPLMSISDCHNELGSNSINENQLCVGGEKGKDSCTGDSGGPLMRLLGDPSAGNIQWYQEGIVSYGRGCGVKGTPAIYTKVSHYRDWIIDTISKRSSLSRRLVAREPILANFSDAILVYDEETNTFQ